MLQIYQAAFISTEWKLQTLQGHENVFSKIIFFVFFQKAALKGDRLFLKKFQTEQKNIQQTFSDTVLLFPMYFNFFFKNSIS